MEAAERQLFAIDGLFCGGCARGLETRLRALEGVIEVGVQFLTATALVRWHPSRCDPKAIEACISSAGYRLVADQTLGAREQRLEKLRRDLVMRLSIAFFFGMWAMGAALVLYLQPGLDSVTALWIACASGVFSAPVIVWAGAPLLEMALRAAWMRSASIDLLIGISVASAVLASIAMLVAGSSHVYFDAAVMLVSLRLLGQWVEARLRSDALAAIRTIEALAPETALLERDGKVVPIADVVAGETILVDAGAVVTMDGAVLSGESDVDRSFLTGESFADRVSPGERIQAGSINLTRRLRIAVDRLAGERDIDRMGGRVAVELSARGTPPSIEDRIARWLIAATPALAGVAFCLGWWRGGGLQAGLSAALATLIVVCPCALAIGRPLAALRLVQQAGRHGLRIADPDAFALLGRCRTIVFDKTGTLTLGEPRVTEIVPTAGHDAKTVIELAALAETGIAHPIARAICAFAGEHGAGGQRGDRQAKGLLADGRSVTVRAAQDRPDNGEQHLDVLVQGRIVGTIALADGLDPAARQAIDHIVQSGLSPVMASGDGDSPARLVGSRLGLDASAVHHSCTPNEKADLVRTLARPVAFVGDGINDAAAMAAADCSISVTRAHGAATAVASVAILEGGLERIDPALNLSRNYTRLLSHNAALALGYNLLVVPLAMTGFMTPVMAAISMTASSMLVIAHATLPRLGSASVRQGRLRATGPVPTPLPAAS